jgi:hypothetical protein
MQVYNTRARENKLVYQQQVRDYHHDSAAGSDKRQQDEEEEGAPKVVCGMCGKGFKTEGGYKYHVLNVCIDEKCDDKVHLANPNAGSGSSEAQAVLPPLLHTKP